MKKNKQKIYSHILTTFVIFSFYLIPKLILAQDLHVQLESPIKIGSFHELLQGALDILIQVSLPVVAGFIIYSGFLYLKAQGNKTELEKANKTFMYTLIGAGVVLGAWTIAKLINETVMTFRNDISN